MKPTKLQATYLALIADGKTHCIQGVNHKHYKTLQLLAAKFGVKWAIGDDTWLSFGEVDTTVKAECRYGKYLPKNMKRIAKPCYAVTRNHKPFRVVANLAEAKDVLGSAIVNIVNGEYVCGQSVGQLIAVDINGDVYSVRRVTPQHAGRIAAAANRRHNQAWFAYLAKLGLSECYPPCPCKGWNN